MDPTARSLADITEPSGHTASDVACLAGVDKSTISRLWDDPEWLDRVSGGSLQALIRVLPGVSEYVCDQTLRSRCTRLTETLGSNGLVVDAEAYRRLVAVDGIPEQYLGNALETAAKVMAGDLTGAASHLMRFWGRAQDQALGYLFRGNPDRGVFVDPAPLIRASTDMADRLAGRTSSFHAIIAQATLTHHVAKVHGTMLGRPAPGQHQSAFSFRSGMVGMIIQTDDVDLSITYGRAVRKTHLLGLVEDWSFPTYMRDAQVTRDFSLPKSLLLSRTAGEVVRELASYNDAYVHYLVSVYLPRSLHRDPTFGLQLPHLVAGIRSRMTTARDGRVVRACHDFLKMTEQIAPAERTRW